MPEVSWNRADLTADIAMVLADALEPLHESVRALQDMLEASLPAVDACTCIGSPRTHHPKGKQPIPVRPLQAAAAPAAPIGQASTPSAAKMEEQASARGAVSWAAAPPPTTPKPVAAPTAAEPGRARGPTHPAGPARGPAGAGGRGQEGAAEDAAEAAAEAEGAGEHPARQRGPGIRGPSRARAALAREDSFVSAELYNTSPRHSVTSAGTNAPTTFVGRVMHERLAALELSSSRVGPVFHWLLSWVERWEGLQEPPRTGCLHRVESSQWFGGISSLVILLNLGFLTVVADLEMQPFWVEPPYSTQKTPEALTAIERGMLGFFGFELLLRLVVHRLYFFVNSDMVWNIFDLLLVAISTSGLLLEEAVGTGTNVSFARTFRLLKLAKLLRAFRILKVFRALAQMLDSFRRSATSLFWSLVMLMFLLYLCSLLCMNGISAYLIDGGSEIDSQVAEGYVHHFGNLYRSVFTLFATVSGGTEWVLIYELLAPVGPQYSMAYLGFIVFFMFAFFNILTGMIVERAAAAAAPARAEQVFNLRRARVEETEEFTKICSLLDVDESGTLSLDELRQNLKNPTMVAYLSSVGLEVHDVDVLFHLIAGSTKVKDIDIGQFVEACMTMKGQATALDMRQQQFQTAGLRQLIERFEANCAERMERLVDISQRLLSRMPSVPDSAQRRTFW